MFQTSYPQRNLTGPLKKLSPYGGSDTPKDVDLEPLEMFTTCLEKKLAEREDADFGWDISGLWKSEGSELELSEVSKLMRCL